MSATCSTPARTSCTSLFCTIAPSSHILTDSAARTRWVGPTALHRFVGSGLHSNEAGFNLMLNEGVFDTGSVAHVRDIFDFHSERPHLTSVFGFAALDVCIVDEVRFCTEAGKRGSGESARPSGCFEPTQPLSGPRSSHPARILPFLTLCMYVSRRQAILAPKRRRLVNEYHRASDGSYVLVAHDVEFAKFLHGRGYRMLVARDKDDFARFAAGAIPPQQSTNHVRANAAHCTRARPGLTHALAHSPRPMRPPRAPTYSPTPCVRVYALQRF